MNVIDTIKIKMAQRALNKAGRIMGSITFTRATVAEAILGSNVIHMISNASLNLDELLNQNTHD